MTVKVPLLPYGLSAKDFADLTLMLAAYYHRDKGLGVRCLEGYVEFSGNADDVCESFATAFGKALDVASAKRERGVPCPSLQRNDREVLGKAFKGLGLPEPPKGASYLETFHSLVAYFKDALEDDSMCRQVVPELSVLAPSRDALLLGSRSSGRTCAPLQLLKVEKYDYGKDFLDLRGSKMDVRATPLWLSVLASGWLLSFNGFMGGALLLAMPPGPVVEAAICSAEHVQGIMDALGVTDPAEAFDPGKGYYATPLRVKASTDPAEAYHMLLALTSPPLKDPSLVPLRIVKVRFDGKTFTMLEDAVVDLSRLKEFAELVAGSSGLRRAVEELLRCAILSYSGVPSGSCKAMFGDNAARMAKLLYNAVMGSLDPLYATYLLSRLSPEPAEAKPYFRRPEVIKGLLKALRAGDVLRPGT